jgi:beta-glucosidase
MMKKKKMISLLLVLSMVTTVLSACKSTKSTPTGAEVSPEVTETLFKGAGTNGNYQYKGKFNVDYSTLEEAQSAGNALTVELAAEGITLLKNEKNVLPLKKNEKNVTLLGIRTARMIRSGFGSGSGGGSPVSNLLGDALTAAGYKVNPKTVKLYTDAVSLMVEDRVYELPVKTYDASITSTYGAFNDAAIITLSRTGAENYDNATNNVPGHASADEHYLQLDVNETALIKHAKQYFSKVIVMINSSNIMQIPELAEPKTADNLGVDAILWVGGVGQAGTTAIAHILNGDVTPSGRTVDLWEKDFTKNPTFTNFGPNTQNKDANGNRLDTLYYDQNGKPTEFANLEYREGIYLGYKYYETLYADAPKDQKEAAYSNVMYPFGYGLSYTSFEWSLEGVKKNATISAPNETVTVQVRVKNVGSAAGKDVVQVYANPPYTKGGIEKAAANLVGFAKTKLLQPGESDVVTVTFYAQDMASFDWNDANKNKFSGYELEKGEYIISANRNSHDVVLSMTRKVAQDIQCKTDLVTGKEIKPVYTGSFSSVNDSLLKGMISRATSLKQPSPASLADRTLDKATLADYKSQAEYYSYQDKESDPWYVKNLPASWNQETNANAAISISLNDMAGVPYTEPTINEKKEVILASDANSQKWEKFMNQFTWDELCSLAANPDTNVPRLGPVSFSVPRGSTSTTLAPTYSYGDPDGPINAGGVQFPSNPIVAGTYNKELASELGRVVGNLLLLNGSRGWRGAGANMHRSPFSGRNFEYYSEDGVLAGMIGAEVAKSVTSKGIIAHFKHFFGNDQETYRADYGGVFTWATEQALREGSAKPFEIIIKDGGTLGLMTAFNRIGKWSQTTNYATHELLLNQEWDFKGSTESDAWAKQYIPANLMVRGGDDMLLTSDSSFPPCALERGKWDPVAKNVRVAANANEYKGYNAGAGTMLSPTHYFAVRKCAQRLLQTNANSTVNNNGFSLQGQGEVITYDLTKGIFNSFKLNNIPGKTNDVVFNFTDPSIVWPDGMAYDPKTCILSGVPTGKTANDVSTTFTADTWVKNAKVTFKFKVNSDIIMNDKPLTDGQVVNLKVGEALNATFKAATLTYGNQLAILDGSNRRIMNAYLASDGVWYHRDEDKSAADIVTLSNQPYDKATSSIYRVAIEGLPEGMTVTNINTMEQGWAGRGSYEVNTAAKISGSATKAGTYSVKVTIFVPHVSKGTNPWMRASGTTMTAYSQMITFEVK